MFIMGCCRYSASRSCFVPVWFGCYWCTNNSTYSHRWADGSGWLWSGRVGAGSRRAEQGRAARVQRAAARATGCDEGVGVGGRPPLLRVLPVSVRSILVVVLQVGRFQRPAQRQLLGMSDACSQGNTDNILNCISSTPGRSLNHWYLNNEQDGQSSRLKE